MKVIGLESSIVPQTGNSDRTATTGLIALVAATTMLLAAFSSAYIVRRGLSNDWVPLHLPPVLAGSAVLLVLSSLALEMGRRSIGAHNRARFARWWFAGPALGACFVLAQAYGWNRINQTGISAASSPSAAFVYVLSGTMVALVIGTAGASIWIGFRALTRSSGRSATSLKIIAYYWHYLGCLWIYLVVLFYTQG
jgi:cytochrome c oxidase subunit III